MKNLTGISSWPVPSAQSLILSGDTGVLHGRDTDAAGAKPEDSDFNQ
jgi:hypothetical protein